jgi:hypothetical protein
MPRLRTASTFALVVGLASVGAIACLPTPSASGLGETDSGLPFDPTEAYIPGETDTDGWSWTGTDAGTAGAATDGPMMPGTTTGDGGTDDPGETDTDGETDPGPTGSFPPAEPFGDSLPETDLVGVWGSPWDTAGVDDITLTVTADGAFVWRETSADCSVDLQATGALWVEGTQLVFHVQTWDKRMPWNTQAEIGLTVAPPFRLRLGYSPMGGFLGLAGPRRLTEVHDWTGRSYDRIDAGTGPQGRWIGESELWALVAGETEPQLVVRERFSADLPGDAGATLTRERSWWWPGPDAANDEPQVGIGGWADQTPGNVAGAATVVGVTHAYDAVHMFSFLPDESLKLGVASDCP